MGLWILLGLVAVGFFYVFWYEPQRLVGRQVSLPLPGLPADLAGFTILHLSDLHSRRWGRLERRLVAWLKKWPEPPDLVVMTGDFVAHNAGIEVNYRIFRELSARYGKFAVLGNNDTEPEIDTARLVARLREAGVQVLVNESRRLEVAPLLAQEGPGEVAGVPLWVVGLDTPYPALLGRPFRFPLEKALRGVPPDAFILLLAHTPDALTEARKSAVDLLLVGHTHGGQLCLPWIGPLSANLRRYGREYAAGVFRDGELVMHVSRGVGTSVVPGRAFCPPEVVLLRLCRANEPD